jgi:hypothetical protein
VGIEYQKYRSLSESRTGPVHRIGTILKKEVLQVFKSKWVIALIIFAYFFIFVTRLLSIVFQSEKFEAEFFMSFFQDGQLWFLLLAAIVGSGLIASDLKTNAIILYFTRIPKISYIVGKFEIFAIMLSVVTLLPSIILFFVALISSPDSLNELVDNFWILGAIVANSLVIIALLGVVSLATSSLSSDKRYAGAGIFIIFLFSEIISEALESILENERLAMVSIWKNINFVSYQLFDVKQSYGFAWYEPLVVLMSVVLCSVGVIYWRVFKKEVTV